MRRSNLAFVFWVHFMFIIFLWMHVFFCVCFSFSVISQDIGWEEHFRNDLFCVGWDIKR